MKILMISYSDANGGAFIACYRTFCAMQNAGINVKLGVVEKRTNNYGVFELPKNPNFKSQNAKRSKKKLLQTANPILHSINKLSKIDVNYINNSNFDIVNLHWIAFGTISIEDIAKIKKPIIWTMHDSWLFSGAEHYPNILENDTRFIEGYTKENFPKTSNGVDICRLTWKRKKKAWKNCKFNVISPSNYEAISFENSALFREQKAIVVPYVISNIFKQVDVKEFKKYMGIPLNKKIIGFGAVNSGGVKGGDYLLKALAKLKNKGDLHIVIFGNAQNEFVNNIKIQSTILGTIFNEKILTLVYNCLDCFVCPSIIDNLPNTCIESLFCGIPVAAFNVGGIPDIVEHKKTGYLAKPYNINDLIKGIEFCLANKKELSKNSILKSKQDFNEKEIVRRYMEVYEIAIKESKIVRI